MVSGKVRTQRRNRVLAPLHKKQDMVCAHLSKELRATTKKRSLRVKKGYVVRVMRGELRGKEGKVTNVYLRSGKVTVEGLMTKKRDGKEKPLMIDPSNLMILQLETTAPKASDKKV